MKALSLLACAVIFAGVFLRQKAWSQPVTGTSATGRDLLLAPGLNEARVLPQNWSDVESRRFYDTSQGSQMMPYAWFLHLEQENSTTLFRDAAHLRDLGYLPRVPNQQGNPDGLPVGFVRNDIHMGLTCAACHTAQINYQGTAWLIDGGPTMANAEKMMHELEAALKATLNDDVKFGRFATAVLGAGGVDDAAKAHLKKDLQTVLESRAGYNARNFPAAGKPPFGPGRIAAFDAIYNEVAVRFAQNSHAETQCDAPVSYPFLWDTPQHNRVQWNGSAPNTKVGPLHVGALGRNVGEVLGVFADVDTTEQELPLGGYPSSVNTGNLNDLEELLRSLWSPQWPEAFGKIDAALAAQGAVLFKEHCASCHKSIKRDDPNRRVVAQMRKVGTDQSMARNAGKRESSSGIFKGRVVFTPLPHILRATEKVSLLLGHLGQRVLAGPHPTSSSEIFPLQFDVFAVIGTGKSQVTALLSPLDIVDGKSKAARVKSFEMLDQGSLGPLRAASSLEGIPEELTQKFKVVTDSAGDKTSLFLADAGPEVEVELPYKARPLNGIWATAPYLHNGSVLNLDELLKPAAQRLPKFRLGSREFDPEHVGYVDAGDFEFDTKAQPGNSNAGHEYDDHVFTDKERKQLIEYLKGL